MCACSANLHSLKRMYLLHNKGPYAAAACKTPQRGQLLVAQASQSQPRQPQPPSKQQEQQDRWWHKASDRPDDWEEERGRGLNESRVAGTHSGGGRGGGSRRGAAEERSRGSRSGGEGRWENGGSGGRNGRKWEGSGGRAPYQQQHRSEYVSEVNRTWVSADWRPAKGRQAMNEVSMAGPVLCVCLCVCVCLCLCLCVCVCVCVCV